MKLYKVFNDPLTGNIFTKLGELYDVPWKGEVDDHTLDIDFISKYGQREISPLLRLLTNENKITPENLEKVANVVWIRYNKQFVKLWNTLSLEYNPIENYRMVESETHDNDRTDTTSNDRLVNSEMDGQTKSKNGIYGFNSTGSVNANDGTASQTSKSTGIEKDTMKAIGKDTGERELTRSGNIGVTTSQQMITSERELWHYTYFDDVYKMVASVLTIPYYKL